MKSLITARLAMRKSLWGACLALALSASPTLAETILRRGNGAEPGSLDPHRIDAAWEGEIVNDLFLGLTTLNATAEPIPGAAESWTVNADGLVWTFKLRPSLQWSDGTPMTAADFVYSFRRMLAPATAAKYASLHYVIKNAVAVNTGKAPPDTLGVRASDARTVEITLETPTPYLPGLVSHASAMPVPPHVVTKLGEGWVKPGHMVSNGPFVLVTNSPHDMIQLRKNPKFYAASDVAIDDVRFFPIGDENVALNRFRAGELDLNVTTSGFPIDQLPWLEKNMPGQAHIAPALVNQYIALNIRRAPFKDVRVRRALSMCLDRETLAEKVTRGQSTPAYAFIPPGIANYPNTARLDFAAWPLAQRIAESKKLLAASGFTTAKPLTIEFLHMSSMSTRRTAVALAAMFKNCGVIVKLLANDPKVHYRAIQEGDFAMATAAWGADYNDAQNFLYLLDSRSVGFNYGGYHNPAFDALMDQASRELDTAKRAALFTQAEQLALDESAVIPLIFPNTRTLVAPTVKGYMDNASNSHPTRWMRLEK